MIMDKLQFRTALVISIVAIIIFILNLIFPDYIKIEEKTLVLLGIAVLPWLSLFYKKIKLPGGVEAESDRQQGSTQEPQPPVSIAEVKKPEEITVLKFSQLNAHSKRIIKTLWKYQKELFKDDYSKRWTFGLYHVSDEYAAYVIGLGELLDLGLISFVKDEKTVQCMLTNDGVKFCEDNVEDINKYEIYYRF